MSPPFIFRIDEIGPNPNVSQYADAHGWMPSTASQANIRVGGGVSGQWWLCNGTQIFAISTEQLPSGMTHYSTFSTYYGDGRGFLVLQGDAANPPPGGAWRTLTFDHDDQDYSSYLTNAGGWSTLFWQRSNQQWPRMLLPDIYHTQNITPTQTYGGLKGELAIFLGLIGFSMKPDKLREYIPRMFVNSRWGIHNRSHGRRHQRGVVVYVYGVPSNWSGGSTADDLSRYEDGEYGKYYD